MSVRTVFICLFTTAICFQVSGANYYVSASGSDSNSGESAEKAWKTIAKVNAQKFQPGDHILLQRGSEWRESLLANSSGAGGDPITFEAFGNGAKPKLLGSDLLENKKFQTDGQIYKISVDQPVNSVLVNHDFLFGGTPVLKIDSADKVRQTPKSWFYDAGSKTLFVNAGSDPRSDGKVYTACVRDSVLNISGQSHVVVRDIVCDETAKFGAGYAFSLLNTSNVLLENCEAYRAGKHHFGVINSTQFVGRDLYGAFAMPGQGGGGASTFVSYSDQSRHDDTSEWVDCVAEHMEDTSKTGLNVAFVSHGEGLGTLIIRNITCRGCELTVASDNPKSTIKILGGTIEDGAISPYGPCLIDGVTIRGPKSILKLDASNVTVQNCLIIGGNFGFDGYQSSIVCGGKNNTVRFCTVVLDSKSPDFNTCVALTGDDASLNLYGNILIATKRVFNDWKKQIDPKRISANYNCYKPEANFVEAGGKSYSFAEVKTRGIEANSITGDPQFVNAAAGDYSLKSSSLAIDSVRQVTIPEKDAKGISRPQGNAAEMGAFELKK